MSVWKNNNTIDTSNIHVRNGLVVSAGDPDSDYVDYGATMMKKAALHYVPKDQPFSTEALWKKLSQIHELASYEVTERFYHIGNKERLTELRNMMKK
jgi:NDP-sugar pyrophosphorylase family protein